MLKKILCKLGPAILLILMLTLVLCATASVAFANTTETRKLTVTFDSTYCSVSYSINGTPMGALNSGESIDVPYRSEDVKVTVSPISGYELKAIYRVQEGTLIKQQVDKQERSYTHDFFNEDVALSIECEAKTYNVTFVPAEGESDISYNFVTENRDKYESLTYTYGGDPVVIEPAVKRSNGYTFKYWDVVNRVVDAQGKVSYEKIDSLLVDSNSLLTIESRTNIFSQWQQTGTIYLRPHFEPNLYKVYRYDYLIKYTDLSAGTFTLVRWLNEDTYRDTEVSLPMVSEASGKWADTEVSPYPGYRFESFTIIKVDIDESKNIVYRYFLPIDYALTFDWNGGQWLTGEIPTQHTFNRETLLPSGKRIGYHFGGWRVLRADGTEAESVETLDALKLSAENLLYTQNNDAETQRKLTLVAIWNPVHYEIGYDLSGAKTEDNAHLPTHYIFNQDLVLPTPVRPGYRFMGWILNGSVEWTPSAAESNLVLGAEAYTANPTLKAKWEAIEYTVTLSGAGGTPDQQTLKVTFDQPLSASGILIPIRAQYRFLGYYHGDVQYIDAEGNSVCNAWDVAEDSPVLEAKWELLPMLEVNRDDYKINYPDEIFQFPAGKYTVIAGDQILTFVVVGESTQKIPDSFFGKTMELVVHSDGIHFSDYHGEIFLTARPAKPRWENDGEIERIHSTDDTTIEILLHPGVDASRLEFALSIDGGKTFLVDWTSQLLFTDMYPGTLYNVYARVKATDVSPGGEIASWTTDTDSLAFVNDLLDRLEAMIRKDAQGNVLDGEMLVKLVRDAKQQIQELVPHTPTFYADAEGIMAHVEATAPFARLQDERIAALRAYLETLLATKAYNEAGEAALNALCSNGIASIQSATLDAEVNGYYDSAYQAMSNVKITYLESEDLHVKAEDGLNKDSGLVSVRHPEFEDKTEQVNAAISAGKVTYNGTDLTPKELIELLETQSVIGAYSLKLTENGSLVAEVLGRFTVKLLLPEELRSYANLRAAYYDAATGTLQVLTSRVEGDYLIFEAPTLADFVILGDPTLNLTAPIVALGIVALCQLIAIALILVSRAQSKTAVRNCGIAFPFVSLAVQVLPANGELWVLILGALVVLLQIILTVLLLNSELMHRSAIRRRPAPYRHREEAIPTVAQVEEPASEEINEETASVDEALSAAMILEDLRAMDVFEEDLKADSDGEAVETEALYEEAYEEEDAFAFEEQASQDAEYSLPEDEDAFAVFDENAEEEYVEEYGEYAEGYPEEYTEEYVEQKLDETAFYSYEQGDYAEDPALTEEIYEDEALYEEDAAYEEELIYGDEAPPSYEEDPIYGDEAVYEDEVVYEDEIVYEDEVVYEEEAEITEEGAEAPYDQDASGYYYKNEQ